MRLDGQIWLGAFMWCLSLQVNAADQSAAFNDAKAYAQGTVDATGSIVSAEKATTFPHYSPNSPVPELVPGSVGLSGVGVGKIQGCQGQSDTECAAVNFLAKNPDQRLRFNIDPAVDQTLQAARQVLANPIAAVGEVQLGTESACTTTTVTDPARYTTETCSSLRAFEGQQCTMGRVVNIDADANYQCDKTLTAFTSQQRQPVVSTSSCVYGRQVDIDADSRFQCDQTVNAYETVKCRRSSSITCTGGGDGCDQGGIVPGSWQGDMAVNWGPSGSGDYNLTFGTIADNYWQGWGATFDRTLTFEIKDKSLLTKFMLTRAAFDDWLWVKVNGNTVYLGPYGGDRLYVIGEGSPLGGNAFCYQNEWSGQWDCSQYIGWSETPTPVGTFAYCSCVGWDGCTWYCNNDGQPGMVKYGPGSGDIRWPELSTSWNIALNIDVRPYLTDGSNTVWMRTIVAGGGEGAVVFTARQRCPVTCSVSADNQCAALEARAK
jgi:hypothetical protein